MTCSRCEGRLFLEHTPDGPERVCLNGHRFAVVSSVPLDISPQPGGRREDRAGKMSPLLKKETVNET